MTVVLRDYQQQMKNDIYAAWVGGARNVVAVLPCGGGKTAIFTNIMQEHRGASVAIAHRTELITQMSVALARNGVRHRVIGQSAAIRDVVRCHMLTVGVSYHDANAQVAVASVNTLVNRDPSDAWFQQVGLWVTDEAHHLAGGNLWHKAVSMFPNARGLGVTATPLRADGKGLGRHADGVMDLMLVGPGMRTLIDAAHLSDYRIFAPASDIDLTGVNVTASGDFSPEPLRAAVHRSHITGDVVAHYLRAAGGKLGVTFAVDVESAVELAAAYRASGVPAEVLTGKTPPNIRYKILQQFARGDVKQICSCDIISEGFDLPAIEVCSMARPTQSYGLFVQQFGRSLRLLDGVPDKVAIILDHVGNVVRHGLPDAPREWSLDRRQRRAASVSDAIPVRVCPECLGVYARVRDACPHCGYKPEPVGRAMPEQVEGALVEMTPEALARLRGEIEASEQLRIPYNATPAIEGHLRKVHRERMEAQGRLRAAMMQWGGDRIAAGDSLSEAQRRFYLTYGIDVASAQMLGAREALELLERIER